MVGFMMGSASRMDHAFITSSRNTLKMINLIENMVMLELYDRVHNFSKLVNTKYVIHIHARLHEVLPTLDNGRHPQLEAEVREDYYLPEARLCVPANEELKRQVLDEAHSSAYTMHPGSTKMYHTLKKHYWWAGMKREDAKYVSKCFICQ
ncbi:uncharacterized protein LOC132803962 [Ziziphus jujuba]|uniref:Uncharacterized protein LOC132803962 n=1 Tax=Ziziphus jujuba TaxID=326968 RepID=A0ABM4AAP1_ZIZJJ|nr:uncharacterized protein LOC132803962 [Ziziphus jujuba]